CRTQARRAGLRAVRRRIEGADGGRGAPGPYGPAAFPLTGLSVLPLLRPFVLALSLCLLTAGAVLAQALEPLAIVTREGQRPAFQVEVARSEADRAQGLMFRRSMAADRGMLFDFERVEPVSMWMQNTYIS